MKRKHITFISPQKLLLAQEVMAVLRAITPQLLTCKEIAEKLAYLHITDRHVYNCIRNLPLEWKEQLNIIYGSGLFKPNKYGIKCHEAKSK